MSLLFKFIASLLVSSAISIFSGALSLYILGYIVHIFSLNHEKDAYWIFSVAFYIMVFMGIISFGLTMTLIED